MLLDPLDNPDIRNGAYQFGNHAGIQQKTHSIISLPLSFRLSRSRAAPFNGDF